MTLPTGLIDYQGFCPGKGDDEYGNAYIITINGVNYLIQEDSCDGYCSHCNDITPTTEKQTNPFNVPALLCEDPNQDGYQIFSLAGNLLCEFGTNTDESYYPYFYCDNYPEAITKALQ